MKKRCIRILHNLPRVGGTLIGRCLGSMQKVVLLSEVHARGKQWYCPRQQAREWFQLQPPERPAGGLFSPEEEFLDAISRIEEECNARGDSLVIRDWTHLDFIGAPFLTDLQFRLSTANLLRQKFTVRNLAVVRHPLYHFYAMQKLGVILPWDDALIVRGIRSFAEHASRIGFIRYEDFCRDPDANLRKICGAFQLDFDGDYKNKWQSYDKITGDVNGSTKTIEAQPSFELTASDLARLAQYPDYCQSLTLLGYEHPQLLQPRITRSVGRQIAEQLQDDWEALFEEGNRHSDQKRFEEAAASYQKVVELQPNHTAALNNLGFCLQKLGKNDWAEFELKRALAIDPHFVLAIRNLIHALVAAGRRFETIPYWRQLTELEPDSGENCFQLAEVLVATGRVDEALLYLRRALTIAPHNCDAAANYLMYLHYSDRESPAGIAREHFRIAQIWSRKSPELIPRPRLARSSQIRIGYLAADFYTHPVGKLLHPILRCHDKQRFLVHCYHHGERCDDWTARLQQAAGVFHKCSGKPSAEIYRQIQEDQIDVLIDLGGFSGGGNRLEIFARRAAPVQISFLGYPDTSGLAEIDYRLTDEFCDPPGQTDVWHSEKLIRLSTGFLCYEPPDDLPPVAPSPHRCNEFVTFGCFNNIAKISTTALRTWAHIVARVPGSRIVFKYGDRYESKWVQEQLRGIFAAEGVDPRRLRFLNSRPDLRSHLEAISEVDIALDAFPYQGTMTTLETLTMSVPIITLEGQTYSRRASSSLLRRLGLNDLVAATPTEYVEAAVDLATAPELLDQIRQELRAQFFASQICDVATFTKELEAALIACCRSV